MGCFSGHLMSSSSDQKLFCEVCSVLNCSFDKFVGEKVVSPSYSSAILAPPKYAFLRQCLYSCSPFIDSTEKGDSRKLSLAGVTTCSRNSGCVPRIPNASWQKPKPGGKIY